MIFSFSSRSHYSFYSVSESIRCQENRKTPEENAEPLQVSGAASFERTGQVDYIHRSQYLTGASVMDRKKKITYNGDPDRILSQKTRRSEEMLLFAFSF